MSLFALIYIRYVQLVARIYVVCEFDNQGVVLPPPEVGCFIGIFPLEADFNEYQDEPETLNS